MDDHIRDFLECSIKQDFSDFDFDTAFYDFYYLLNDKLIHHGFCDEETFIDKYVETMNDFGFDGDVENFTLSNNYIHISNYDVLEAIAKMHYEKSIDAFANLESFQILDKLRDKLDNRSNLEENELIQLFDECIHAQHETGSICEVDIEQLKQKLDKKYENVKVERMFEPVTA